MPVRVDSTTTTGSGGGRGTGTTSGATAGNGLLGRLKAIKEGLDGVLGNIRSAGTDDYQLTPREQTFLKNTRLLLPNLVRSCADMMDFGNVLFTNFPFQGQDLRADEEEVRAVEEFLSFVGAALTEIGDYLNRRRNRMVHRTLMMIDQVDGYKTMAVKPAGLETTIADVATPIEDILGQVQQKAKRGRTLRGRKQQQSAEQTAAVQAQLDASNLEVDVLRGKSLTAEDMTAATPAAQKGRRGTTAGPRTRSTGRTSSSTGTRAAGRGRKGTRTRTRK